MLLEEQAGGLLSVADRKLFFRVFELDERIATLPDSWAISTIMTRVREMKKVEDDGLGTLPEDKPAEGSLAALQEWLRAADSKSLIRVRPMVNAECERRAKAAHAELVDLGYESGSGSGEVDE